MKFQHWDLGYKKRGEVVEVTLSGNAANVRLMDGSNFSSYKGGRRHRYVGGLAKKSPVRLQIPSTGHWHVAVDLQGLGGSVRTSVRVLPQALPAIQDAPLASVPTLLRPSSAESNGGEKTFDVFISHASEDKKALVRPLAESLRTKGLRVWFDDFELRIGSSLRQTIDLGIARSRFGVVVFSRAFFSKPWPAYELDGIVTRNVSGEQDILPIWHGVTKQEVIDFSPSLADKVARSTATHTVEEIATEIASLIHSERVH